MLACKNISLVSFFVLNELAGFSAFANDDSVKFDIEVLREQTQEDKERLVDLNMNLTETETETETEAKAKAKVH